MENDILSVAQETLLLGGARPLKVGPNSAILNQTCPSPLNVFAV